MTQEIIDADIDADALKALVATGGKQMQEMRDRLNTQTAEQIAVAKQYTTLLKGSGYQWMKDASPGAVMVFTRAAVGLGLNPLIGDCFLIHGGFYVSVQGRRKLASWQTDGEGRPYMVGESEPRLLTPAENALHGVHDGDVARIVEVWHREWKMPATGVGIVRKGEIEAAQQKGGSRDGKYNLPLADRPEYMAEKRAVVAALRKAFPDLDCAVADMADRGAGKYTVSDVATGRMLLNEPTEPEAAPAPAPTPTEPPAPPPMAAEVQRQVSDIVWGSERDADVIQPVEEVLGCTAEQWLAMGFTDEDAAEVAFATRAHMDRPPGMALADAAAAVHGDRARAGLPFVARMIPTEPSPAPASDQDSAPPPEPGDEQPVVEQPGLPIEGQ